VTLFRSLVFDLWGHKMLRYQWVRYLTVDAIPDDFWGELQRDLMNVLMIWPVFVDCCEQRLGKRTARIVPTWLRDDDGDALLPDCNCVAGCNATYISKSYDWDIDVPVLKKLGVQELASEEFVHKLQVDLNKGNAFMWSKHVDDKWHTKIAEVLLKMMSARNLADHISLLPLIPLIGKKPAPSKGVSIYLPNCGGIDVPSDLRVERRRHDARQ